MDCGIRASDHMIVDGKMLTNFKPCHENLSIIIADGSLLRVASTRFVKISKNLTLNSILLVSKLECNLLPISRLPREHTSDTKSVPNFCEF